MIGVVVSPHLNHVVIYKPFYGSCPKSAPRPFWDRAQALNADNTYIKSRFKSFGDGNMPWMANLVPCTFEWNNKWSRMDRRAQGLKC